MGTETERHVLVRLAPHVEPERVVEDGLVSVGLEVSVVQRLARCDLRAPDDGVLGRGPHELLDRGDPTDHLLDDAPVDMKVGVGLQPMPARPGAATTPGGRRRWWSSSCRGPRWR